MYVCVCVCYIYMAADLSLLYLSATILSKLSQVFFYFLVVCLP